MGLGGQSGLEVFIGSDEDFGAGSEGELPETDCAGVALVEVNKRTLVDVATAVRVVGVVAVASGSTVSLGVFA